MFPIGGINRLIRQGQKALLERRIVAGGNLFRRNLRRDSQILWIQLEGALKLKEISYIHAEGYPAGEMKHGPIALIDEQMPVVAIAPHDRVFEKMLSNIEEVKARSGIVIAVTDRENADLAAKADAVIVVPATHELLAPLLMVLPLQLLAYHITLLLGCDVDQPRNLAKSVTVE